ncbi:MAG TPA: hypothetical protein VE934_15410 [Polaromonas sp.]|uniref:DUF6929 family protein n=1 Tax=Polaromonas sp. TaxID=1869339 RepID=UPI002D46DBBE|nr:hypothetical protein [Polaromonas sp.]HYW58343.1 hypothetical protein [Polaromonas sp.]
MLNPVHLRDLLVDPALHPRGQAHLSAASGLVQVGRCLYVVADDEHHLGMFEADAGFAQPVQLHRILPGDLPRNNGKRKTLKPDLEVLALLPAMPGQPHVALLALGSGSKPNRQQAFLISLDAEGKPGEAARSIDLTMLYQPLREQFADLNIEGAFIAGQRLHLLQRGNKGDGRNACIEYAWPDFQAWISGVQAIPPRAARISEFALGHLGDVPLGFTDGTPLPGGGWLFSAVAEDTSDSYNDGACAGSVIGWVGGDGKLQCLEPIEGAPKVEGIALVGDDRLLMVTDSDDPKVASQLLRLELVN